MFQFFNKGIKMKEVNDMRQMTQLGRQIENNSFAVIDNEVGPHDFNSREWEVVRRVIHSTADFEYKHLVKISPNAIDAGIAALRGGCNIIADVKMITIGLNKARLDSYGCTAKSYISDEDVIATAKENNSTRAIESIRKAHSLGKLEGSIVAVGNAPTALIETVKIFKELGIKPALIIGVPVGFVSAVESKEEVLDEKENLNFILTRGRKGGSTIAVSIIHALLKLSVDEANE
jgi:precorrin-8X/cobalt-precorrin-8 methylmutase